MESFAPLVDGVVNKPPFHINSHPSDADSNRSHPALFLADSMPHIVINWTEVRAVGGKKSGS